MINLNDPAVDAVIRRCEESGLVLVSAAHLDYLQRQVEEEAVRARGRILGYEHVRRALARIPSSEIRRIVDNYEYLLTCPELQARIGRLIPELIAERMGLQVGRRYELTG